MGHRGRGEERGLGRGRGGARSRGPQAPGDGYRRRDSEIGKRAVTYFVIELGNNRLEKTWGRAAGSEARGKGLNLWHGSILALEARDGSEVRVVRRRAAAPGRFVLRAKGERLYLKFEWFVRGSRELRSVYIGRVRVVRSS